MTYKADFKSAYIKANEFLVQNASREFPFKFKSLIKEFTDIQLVTFRQLRELGHDPILICGSKEACLLEEGGRYYIFYDSSLPKTKNRFSLSHELGHYFLNHDMRNNLTDINPDLYKKQEMEANFFSAQLLIPDQLLIEITRRGYKLSVFYLTQAFQVSKEAAQKRMETLRKRREFLLSTDEKMYDDIILGYYKNFMNKIAPKKQMYSLEDEYEKQRERDSWY